MIRRECAALVFASLLGESAMYAEAVPRNLLEIHSSLTFEETLERLSSAIRDAGMWLFATIDHSAAAASVGLSMPLTTVLIYGNPKGGTPAMVDSPNAALDLPLRVLVRADGERGTIVAFHRIAPVLVSMGVSIELANRLTAAQAILVAAVQR